MRNLKTTIASLVVLMLLGVQSAAIAKPIKNANINISALGALPSDIQKRLVSEANYLLFPNQPKTTDEATFFANVKSNVKGTEIPDVAAFRNNQVDLTLAEKDRLSKDKTFQWLPDYKTRAYRSFRFLPARNRMKSISENSLSWVNDNPGNKLDELPNGWCAWFASFMLRGSKVEYDTFAPSLATKVLKAGGKNIHGRGASGVWFDGEVSKEGSDPNAVSYKAQAGDLFFYYYGASEANIGKSLRSKSGVGFVHVALVVSVKNGVPYVLEGNRGDPMCTLDSSGKCKDKDKQKGWGYMRLNTDGAPKSPTAHGYKGYVVIRPNWK